MKENRRMIKEVNVSKEELEGFMEDNSRSTYRINTLGEHPEYLRKHHEERLNNIKHDIANPQDVSDKSTQV